MPSDYKTDSRETNRRVHTTYSTGQWSPTVSEHSFTQYHWEQRTSRRNGWNRRSRKSDRDIGGDFKLLKYTEEREDFYVDEVRAWGGTLPYLEHWWGNLSCIPSTNSWNSLMSTFSGLEIKTGDLQAYGSILEDRASPTAPQAGLTTALVELKREGLPSLSSEALKALVPGSKRGASSIKGAGGDYLNYQFGWVPLVSDLRSLAKSVIDADSLVSQLYRDNGKVVRRSRGLPKTILSEETELGKGYFYPALGTYLYPIGQSMTPVDKSVKTTRSVWFSGAFMYHVPDDIGPIGDLRRLAVEARYLYGLSVSPIDVWNLVPWSWLVDWFVNSGSVLSRISDRIYNQQVLKYGYVMCETTRHEIYTSFARLGRSGNIYTPTASRTWCVKQRVQASPFGFGLSWDGFTPYQLSILSALGLSRGR